MSTITPQYRTVQQLLQNQSFSIDEYQREYKWDKENIDELLSDLQEKFISCYRSGHDTSAVSSYEDYFLGSIIVCKRGVKNILIDGQQRVTSLTLLLIYLYHEAQKQKLGVVSTLAPMIYADNLGKTSFNLDISDRLPVIEALYKDEPFSPDDKEESIQNIYARYNDILSKDLAGELGKSLPHFIYWLMTKVGLIEIATDNDNYAYAIFETMNDRGKSLSPVDMLKAYLLAPVGDADRRRDANQKWKHQVLSLISWNDQYEPERDATCIKAWLRAQYAETVRERRVGAIDKDWELIGTTFHRWVRDNYKRLELGSQDQNLYWIETQFPFFSNAYRTILDASSKFTVGLESIYYNAQNGFTWQNTVLLAPLCVTDDTDTVRKKLAATATYLDIWLMRRVINYIRVGYSTTSYTMYNLCKDIRNLPLPKLVQVLTDKLADDEVTFDGSPSRDRNGINDLYLNQFTHRYIFHLLARLTSFVETQCGSPDPFEKYVNRTVKNPYDIEHIWADNYAPYAGEFATANEFQNWRNHIAGLLLLPADVNRSLQDLPYTDKSPFYEDQNFYTASLTAKPYSRKPKFLAFRTRESLPFESYATYGKNEQLKRRALVYALVTKVWSADRISEVLK